MTVSFICGIKVIPLFWEIKSHRKRREKEEREGWEEKKRERVKGLTERGEWKNGDWGKEWKGERERERKKGYVG